MNYALAALLGAATFALLAALLGSSVPPRRRAFVRAALARLGTPYEWGGGHMNPGYGVDCSGLVIQALRDAGENPFPGGESTSNGWYHALPRTSEPAPGDLGLYGSAADRATHVVIVTKYDPTTQTASIVGANHGDSSVTSPAAAAARGAKVEEQGNHLYRNDFLGFVKMPLDEDTSGVHPTAAMRKTVNLQPQTDEA